MAIREMTMAKLSQLPDGLLAEVDGFIDFLAMKHSVKIAAVKETASIAESWKQWVEETDRDYQQGLSGLMTEWDSEEDEEVYGYLQ